MKRHDAEDLFTSFRALSDEEITTEHRLQVESLIQHPGFPILAGLMLGEREAFRTQLENYKVFDQASAMQMGVTQGLAKAMDRLRHVALDVISVPTDHEEN